MICILISQNSNSVWLSKDGGRYFSTQPSYCVFRKHLKTSFNRKCNIMHYAQCVQKYYLFKTRLNLITIIRCRFLSSSNNSSQFSFIVFDSNFEYVYFCIKPYNSKTHQIRFTILSILCQKSDKCNVNTILYTIDIRNILLSSTNCQIKNHFNDINNNNNDIEPGLS